MKTRTILLLAPNPILALCLEEQLQALPFIVKTTDKGQTAIAIYQKHRPEYILLDEMHAEIRPFLAALSVLAPLPNTKLLFLTGLRSQELPTFFLPTSIQSSILYKPYSRAQLRAQLSHF